MLGRQLMGKVESRLQQGKAGQNPLRSSLGGLSCVGVCDPAQIEAINEQQMYDTSLHKETHAQSCTDRVVLSNSGLGVYSGFSEVIILQTVHRASFHANPIAAEERAPNDRGDRLQTILTRFRGMAITHGYYCPALRSKEIGAFFPTPSFFQTRSIYHRVPAGHWVQRNT